MDGKTSHFQENGAVEAQNHQTEKIGRYEEYAARYNRHLQNGGLGACAEDLYLMAAALREEGRRHDEAEEILGKFVEDARK